MRRSRLPPPVRPRHAGPTHRLAACLDADLHLAAHERADPWQQDDPSWAFLWAAHIDSLGVDPGRRERGRRYGREGRVRDLTVRCGHLSAYVSGEYRYRVTIRVAPLSAERWTELTAAAAPWLAEAPSSLRGDLPAGLKHALCPPVAGLLPAADELTPACDCPDRAPVCKHVVAVLDALTDRLPATPNLLFTLRQVADLGAAPRAPRRRAPGARVPGSGPDETRAARPTASPRRTVRAPEPAAEPVRPALRVPVTQSPRVLTDAAWTSLFGVALG